jgi:hypothetical protein
MVLVFSSVQVLFAGSFGVGVACSSSVSEVVFTAQVPEIGMTLTLRSGVDYTEDCRVEAGEQVEIAYSLEPAECDIMVEVPLSDLSLGFFDDEVVEIPLPFSPLGSISVNVLPYLVQLPPGIASLDIVIDGEVRATSCSCSLGTATIETSVASLTWQDSGERTVSVTTSPASGTSTIRTVLAYALSVGFKATVFGYDIWILEPTSLYSASGTPYLETEIETYERSSSTVFLIGGAIAAVAVVASVGLLLLKRRSP